MNKIIFVFFAICMSCTVNAQSQNPDGIQNLAPYTTENPFDTLYFSDIYNFYGLENEKYLKINFLPGWQKYFLPEIMNFTHYPSGVPEINPKYFNIKNFTATPESEKNFLNLNHIGYYNQADLNKIYFLANQENILFYKYKDRSVSESGGNQKTKMQYFILHVTKSGSEWQVNAMPIQIPIQGEIPPYTRIALAHRQ